MDDECSLQDVARCHRCETPEPSLHCDICDKHLCKNCEEKHIRDKPQKHEVVPFKERMIIPKCQKHSFKKCELHCKPCDIPLCVSCVSSEEHKQHEIVDILIYEKNKKNVSQTNLQESKITTYPKKQEKKPSFKQQTTEKMKRMFNKHRERMIPLTIVLSVFVIAVVFVVVVASRERLGN